MGVVVIPALICFFSSKIDPLRSAPVRFAAVRLVPLRSLNVAFPHMLLSKTVKFAPIALLSYRSTANLLSEILSYLEEWLTRRVCLLPCFIVNMNDIHRLIHVFWSSTSNKKNTWKWSFSNSRIS